MIGKYFRTITVIMLVLFSESFLCRADYCRYTGNSTNPNGRRLVSFTLSGSDGSSFSLSDIQPTSTGPVYIDKTANIYTVKRGSTITPTVNWSGGWMHSYIYIDYNRDGSFSYTINPDGTVTDTNELRAYTYYSGKNSKGESVDISSNNGMADPWRLSPFKISDAIATGDYRARLKIDWNSIDPCGDAGIGGNGGCICDFTIRVTAPIRKVTVVSSSPVAGSAFIDGITSSSVTKEGAVKLVAIPAGGYRFVNWTEGNTVLSTEKVYNDNLQYDHTVKANFTTPGYSAMSRTFTGNANQQNRYLKTVTTTGTYTPTVFTATTEAELPYTAFTVSPNTYTASGALIDKTSYPIIIKRGTGSFTINFKAWTNSISGNNPEIKWTQQAAFVDWNGNGSFNDLNEIYPKSSSDNTNDSFVSEAGYTRTINIPAGTGNGTYRIRIVYYEPATGTEEWQNTIFTDKEGKLRNGIAYDFTLLVTDNPYQAENIVFSTSDNPVWYLIRSAPAEQKFSITNLPYKFSENAGGIIAVSLSTKSEKPEPSFEDKYLWRFEGNQSECKIICKTGHQPVKPIGVDEEQVQLVAMPAGGWRLSLSDIVTDSENRGAYYFTSKEHAAGTRLMLSYLDGYLYAHKMENDYDINPKGSGIALFNLMQKDKIAWNMVFYSGGEQYRSYSVNNIDSIKNSDKSFEIYIKNGASEKIVLNNIDSMVFKSAAFPQIPSFGNISKGEVVTTEKQVTITGGDSDAIYWDVNGTGTPSNIYTGAINLATLSNGEKTLRAVTMKDGVVSEIRSVKFTLNIVPLPAMPVITYSGTSTQTPYCRGYINVSATGNVTVTYNVDGGTWKTYSNRIDIKSLSSGTHTVTVKVTDNTYGTSVTKSETVTYNGADPTNSAKWLDHISDHIRLSQLTIPGTHETCATGGTIWHQCQNSSVTSQLNQGIRVMDLRIGNGMDMYHGSTGMGINLSSVLNEVKNFLNNNPSEFVILSVKDENWSGDQTSWTNQVASLMDGTGKAYIPGSSYDYTVGELRGKFIIIRRYGYFGGSRGIDVSTWPNDWYTNSPSGTPPLMIQDAYNYAAELASSAAGRKWGYAQRHMDAAKNDPNNGIIYLNFMTATSISTPGDWANNMVPKLNNYLNSNQKGRYGFIMLDYVGTHTGAVSNLIRANKYPEL